MDTREETEAVTLFAHHVHLAGIAAEDVRLVVEKDRQYGASWKRRGGIGAYMMAIRHMDRLEVAVRQIGYDVFAAIELGAGPSQGADGTALAMIRDARRYLLLIEAEMTSRGLTDRSREGEGFDREVEDADLHGTIETGGSSATYFEGRSSQGTVRNEKPALHVLRIEQLRTHPMSWQNHYQRQGEIYVLREEVRPPDYAGMAKELQRLYTMMGWHYEGHQHRTYVLRREAIPTADLPLVCHDWFREEVNTKELEDLPAYARVLYEWLDDQNKWRLRSWVDRTLWARNF